MPTGTVNVCLVDANGRALINSETLEAGQATRRYRGKRFRVTFGNGQARLRAGGRTIDVPDRSTPVGYEVRPGKRPRELSAARRPTCSVRAGILITGTEVLSGIISDRNGPWLSERLRERGVEVAQILIVADRRGDMRAALDFMAAEGLDLVVTSGGLGPTADDLTAEVVADFAGRPLALDPALEERIWAILERLRSRWRNLDEDAIRASNRKQALVPDGATVLEPVGTAPGLIVPGSPTVLVLPGPPRELQPMWETAVETEPLRTLLERAGTYEQRIMRLFGIPESEIARSLREIEADGVPIDRLEITTCLRRGRDRDRDGLRARRRRRSTTPSRRRSASGTATRCSRVDGATVDDQVIGLLDGRTVAVAESCTGGLMAARLTERGGLLGVHAGRRHRLLQRGQDRARGRARGADRAPRRGLAGGRRGARGRRAGALRRRRRDRHHRHRGPRRRDRGEAGRHRLPERRGRRRRALGPHRAAPRRPPDDPRADHHRDDARPATAAP